MTAYGAVDWSAGPASVYERLAHALVAYCPVSLAGARVLASFTGSGRRGNDDRTTAPIDAVARAYGWELPSGSARSKRCKGY